MQSLTLEETALKEEMKSRCLSKGNYIDENAKAKFEMLCHLEDFEVQYWELKKQVKKQKEVIDKITEIINYYGIDEEHNDDLILRHILKNMLNILKEVSE